MPFNITYLSGSVSGYIASDIVRLGQYEIYSQVFGPLRPLFAKGWFLQTDDCCALFCE
jgi:hypothetical protein